MRENWLNLIPGRKTCPLGRQTGISVPCLLSVFQWDSGAWDSRSKLVGMGLKLVMGRPPLLTELGWTK